MRIVSGKYRGKKLKEFDLDSTRPTTDKVKESIFNLIQFDVADAVVLDLFAGTGALGVEAISRGAKKTILVDSNIKAIKLIKENLIGIDGDYEIVQSDYLQYLKSAKTKFDIVLLDPPYKEDFGLLAIDFLIKNNLMSDDGIIIFETSDDKVVDFNYDDCNVARKKYGAIAVYKLQRINNEI